MVISLAALVGGKLSWICIFLLLLYYPPSAEMISSMKTMEERARYATRMACENKLEQMEFVSIGW